MPNYCENILTISVNEVNDELPQGILSYLLDENGKLTFGKTRPRPEEVVADDTWYDWCCDNWGTKWDLNGELPFSVADDEIVFKFRTAWSPPVEWATYISSCLPEVIISLDYMETGNDFAGSHTVIGGVATKEEDHSVTLEDWILFGGTEEDWNDED